MHLVQYFKNLFRSRYILSSLISKDLRNKYRRSFLGVAWSVLTPLGLVLIIGGVYSIIWGQDPKVLIPRLFTGLTPWICISTSAESGCTCFVSAEGYIKQTMTNIEIFPVRTASVSFVNYLYSSAAFFVVYFIIMPTKFSLNMLMVIPGMLIMYMFCVGIASISGVINIHIRDYQPLQSLIFQALFYATPIIYPKEIIANKGYSFIYEINPFYYIIEVIRLPMTGDGIPSQRIYLFAILISVTVFCCGAVTVNKIGRKLIFKL